MTSNALMNVRTNYKVVQKLQGHYCRMEGWSAKTFSKQLKNYLKSLKMTENVGHGQSIEFVY